MDRVCLECSTVFTARRSTARFCTDLCRTRARVKRQSAGGSSPSARGVERAGAPTRPLIYESAVVEFERGGVSGSVAATQALSIAILLDDAGTADASRSGLSREFSRLRAEALRDVPTPGDPVDEIRARVAAKRLGAGAAVGREANHPLSAYLN